MNRRKTKAIAFFREGYNCAQSIIGSFEDQLGNNTHMLMDMAAGFGAGMGRLQKTCGAVTGAFIVMSSMNNPNLPGARERLDRDIQDFAARFQEHFGELNCKGLIQYDLNSEHERQKANENGTFENKCQQYIEFSIDTLEELLSNE